jgi:hypothetical protein
MLLPPCVWHDNRTHDNFINYLLDDMLLIDAFSSPKDNGKCEKLLVGKKVDYF